MQHFKRMTITVKSLQGSQIKAEMDYDGSDYKAVRKGGTYEGIMQLSENSMFHQDPQDTRLHFKKTITYPIVSKWEFWKSNKPDIHVLVCGQKHGYYQSDPLKFLESKDRCEKCEIEVRKIHEIRGQVLISELGIGDLFENS